VSTFALLDSAHFPAEVTSFVVGLVRYMAYDPEDAARLSTIADAVFSVNKKKKNRVQNNTR